MDRRKEELMKKIYLKVCKLSILAACICLTIFVGYSFIFNKSKKIIIPFPLAVILVIATFFAAVCLLSASALEIYRRVKMGGKGAVKALLIEIAVIAGLCFAITKKFGSLLTAVSVVVGSWGISYILRKNDTTN